MRTSEKTLIPGQVDAICPMRASQRWLRFVCGPHQVLDVASGAALRPFVQLFGTPLGLLAGGVAGDFLLLKRQTLRAYASAYPCQGRKA